MKAHEIGTIKLWCGNTYRVTIRTQDGLFYAVLGHRQFQVRFNPETHIWNEVPKETGICQNVT